MDFLTSNDAEFKSGANFSIWTVLRWLTNWVVPLLLHMYHRITHLFSVLHPSLINLAHFRYKIAGKFSWNELLKFRENYTAYKLESQLEPLCSKSVCILEILETIFSNIHTRTNDLENHLSKNPCFRWKFTFICSMFIARLPFVKFPSQPISYLSHPLQLLEKINHIRYATLYRWKSLQGSLTIETHSSWHRRNLDQHVTEG